MAAQHDGSQAPAKVALGQEPDFDLGGLRISPSACKVANGGGEERVEPRVMEVLVVLARNAGRTVTREQLIDACWEGRAVSDDAVTRVIAKLRAIARGTEPPHFALETVPKVGFRLTAAAAKGAEETTPPDESATQQPPPRAQWQRLWPIAAAAAVAAVALTVWFAVQPPAPPSGAPRVVVAPINVLQTLSGLHRIAAATTASLIESLTGAGLRTALSTAPGESADPQRDVMLSGSTDFDGARYRVNLTLTRRAGAHVLWSGSFERQAAELRGLEQEVAYDVASILRCAFKERNPPVALMPDETLALFMKACEGMIGWRSSVALEATRRLVTLAPGHADAHAFRALALETRSQQLDHLTEEARELLDGALLEANKALALDPNAAAAHVALAKILESKANYVQSEGQYRRALESDPEYRRALDEYGKFLRQMGRNGAASEMFTRIPSGPGRLIQEAFLRAMNGETVAAENLLEQLALMRPSWASGARYMVTAFWIEPETALAKLRALEQGEGARDISCVEAHLKTLRNPDPRSRRGLPDACRNFNADWKIRMLARQGDIDGAYALMQALPNSRSFYAFLFYPEMKAFRHDPRFMPLTERLGLLQYWREANAWPDFCAEPGLPYDCRAWKAGE